MAALPGDRQGHARAYVLIGRYGAWGCVDPATHADPSFRPIRVAREEGRSSAPARLEWQRMLAAIDAQLRDATKLPLAATVLVEPTLVPLQLPGEPETALGPRAWLHYAQRLFADVLGAPGNAQRRVLQPAASAARLVGAIPTPFVEMSHIVRLLGVGQRRSAWSVCPSIAFAWNMATAWRRPTPARPLIVVGTDSLQTAAPTPKGLLINPCIRARIATPGAIAAELAVQGLTPHNATTPIVVDLCAPFGRPGAALRALLSIWPDSHVFPWPALNLDDLAVPSQAAPRRPVATNALGRRGFAR